MIPYCAVLLGVTALSGEVPAGEQPFQLVQLSSPAFAQNAGQWPEAVRFLFQSGGRAVQVRTDGIWIQGAALEGDALHGHAVRIEVLSGEDLEVAGLERSPGSYSFFRGDDPTAWRTEVPGCRAVVFRSPEMDLRLTPLRSGFEWELSSYEKGEIEDLMFRVHGAETVGVDPSGALRIETPGGRLTLAAPTWRGSLQSGTRTRFYAMPGDTFFSLGILETDGPSGGGSIAEGGAPGGLEWSSFLGTSGAEYIWTMDVGSTGEITVGGETSSPLFPTTPGPFSQYGGWDFDGFVTQIDPDGPTLVFSAFIGGNRDDEVQHLVVEASGVVAVGGETESFNFPTTPGAYNDQESGEDIFVLRLAQRGTAFVYSTFLDDQDDRLTALDVDDQGSITVGGYLFPGGPFQFRDGFVTRVAEDGSALIFSTPLAGASTNADAVSDVLVLPDGRSVVAGGTHSPDFPVTVGAFDTSHNGGSDTFVTILEADGATLSASTFLGGSGSDGVDGVVRDESGRLFLLGQTTSVVFPTTPGAFQTTLLGFGDFFMARMDENLTTLEQSTLLGGTVIVSDSATDIEVDPSGIVTVLGSPLSQDFPSTPGAWAESQPRGSGTNLTVTRLSPDFDRLFYSTFLGGTDGDAPFGLALDSHGSVVVAGYTLSDDYPTTPDAWDTTFEMDPCDCAADGFISRLSLLPTGVSKYGVSKPACLGDQYMGVSRMAVSGDPEFSVFCSGAPPSSAGALLLGFGAGELVLPQLTLYLDLFKPVVAFTDLSDPFGFAELEFPLPPNVAGITIYFQYLWINTAECGGFGTLSNSNALSVTIQ